MDEYTDLENKQINDLFHVIKEKHRKPKFKELDVIVDDMVNALHNDNRVTNIYNKGHITKGTLKKMFISKHFKETDHQSHMIHNHEKIIDEYSNQINKRIEHHNNIKKKRTSCCIIL